MSNPWDNFPSIYGTIKSDSDITSDNADNILITWPVILDFIKQYGKGSRLLEYGCGTGSFAYKISQLGYDVTGIDSSLEMIKTAKSAFGKQVHFLAGDSSDLCKFEKEKFSVVTSIMTFQFVESIEKAFQDINNVLESGGIFTFAVFNPIFVKECLRKKTFFEDFDSFEKPKKGIFHVRGNRIPVFTRTAQKYNDLLKKLGFKPLLESYPPFKKEFLRKYPISNFINESEYLLLGYKKR